MKLPKKYHGVTPGEWSLRRIFADEKVGAISGHAIDAPQWRQLASVHFNLGVKASKEWEINAILLADSPRLAAAVVDLREALEESYKWLFGNRADCKAETANELADKITAAIASTEEWGA